MPDLLSDGARPSSLREKLRRTKNVVGYHLGHFIPSRPFLPLEEAIHVAARRGLQGDYAEFGVYTGRSFIRAHFHLTAAGWGGRKMFAFDSFEGLPDLASEDAVRYRDFEAGSYSCSAEQFLANVVAGGVPRSRVVTISGWFSETCSDAVAHNAGLDKIAVAHIDCDLYSATLDVLNFLSSALEDGGIVVFDDYGSYRSHPELGQRGAFASWRRVHPEVLVTTVREAPTGSSAFSLHKPLSDDERAEMDAAESD